MPLVDGYIAVYEEGTQVGPSQEQLLELSTVMTENIIEVLVDSFPQQLGFQSGPEQQIAEEVVREVSPEWVWTNFDTYANGFPVVAGETPTDGVYARLNNGLLENVLNEDFQNDLVRAIADSVTEVFEVEGMEVNLALENFTGNALVPDTLLTAGSVDKTLISAILEATDASNLDLTLDDLFGNNKLKGGGGDDTLTGYDGSDVLSGGNGNDILIGIAPDSISPGYTTIDTLTGGEGFDTFVLGDAEHFYYSDIDRLTEGTSDYALITDFNPDQDTIQLHGTAEDYRLFSSSEGLPEGTAIYADQSIDGMFNFGVGELIAVVQDITPSELFSASSNFTFETDSATCNEEASLRLV